MGMEKFPVRAKVTEGKEREQLYNAQAALMPFSLSTNSRQPARFRSLSLSGLTDTAYQ
jgi:hypothetical protein